MYIDAKHAGSYDARCPYKPTLETLILWSASVALQRT